MRVGVVVLPGSNCDHDALHVVNDVLGAEAEVLWHKETDLKGVDCVIIPGGFAYGDYLRAGALAKFAPIMEPIRRHAAGVKFLPGRDGGSLAHRRRQLKEPFVAEGLPTGRRRGLGDFV